MEPTQKANKIKCFHCGDDCSHNPVKENDKAFCCEGCKTVYLLLKENNLCTYYDLESNPGITIKARALEKFEWLDLPELNEKFFEYKGNGFSRTTFYIPSIHCSSCIWLLENLSRLHSGVFSTKVSFTEQKISISFNPEVVSLRKLAEILDSLGYTPELTVKSDHSPAPRPDRRLLYKIGIAGFCAGNIMLLSFPEYFGLTEIDHQFKRLFGLLNLILSLPVVFYAASEYFTAAWSGLRNKHINLDVPIALGISSVFLRSCYEVITQTGPGYFDSLTGLIFFLLIGRWYQKKTYQRFAFERDHQSYFPIAVTRELESTEQPTYIRDLKPGDTIMIRSNEVIPVDSYLLEGDAWIDYSFVSGENIPVKKETGDLIYAGGKQTKGRIKLRVKEKFAQSYFLQLWNKEVFSKPKNAYLSSFVLRFSKYFTIATLLIAAATFIFWYFIQPERALFAFTSVLLITCPCALALSLPFALGNGLRRLARSGFYAKDADTLEILSEADTIIFDKTGTITTTGNTTIRYYGKELFRSDLIYLRSTFMQSSHPLSRLLYDFIKAETLPTGFFIEIPSQGIHCDIGENKIRVGSAGFIGITDRSPINGTRIYIEINDEYQGYFEIRNQYREGVEDMLKELRHHYSLHLLSGDNTNEALFLRDFFKQENMHFHQKPNDKLEYIERLQKEGKKVIMIGDGLNDAGALKAANAGLVVSDNVYNFFPSSDGMIKGAKLNRLPLYLKYAKYCTYVIKGSLVLSVAYNLIGLGFAVTGNLSPLVAALLMPISSVSAVLFVIAGTGWRKIE